MTLAIVPQMIIISRAPTRTRAFLLASKGECPQRAPSPSQAIMKRIALGLSMYSAAALIGLALVYIQIRIIHDCGLLSLIFGAAEWKWFLGYCS